MWLLNSVIIKSSNWKPLLCVKKKRNYLRSKVFHHAVVQYSKHRNELMLLPRQKFHHQLPQELSSYGIQDLSIICLLLGYCLFFNKLLIDSYLSSAAFLLWFLVLKNSLFISAISGRKAEVEKELLLLCLTFWGQKKPYEHRILHKNQTRKSNWSHLITYN